MSGKIEIWTDGACSGNPGPGGWGALIRANGKTRELKGGEPATTNNRMELLAAISALESLPPGATANLYTDSQYLRDGITKWMLGWKRNGWRTADKKPVKNQELWQRLEQAANVHKVNWHWLRSHVGHSENERADELAREGMQPFLRR
ncbi:MAG: ribonuclease HI [Xanthobacteraceae bacterium]